ncbi:pimeloyl-ACP methyl ester carboxylesterase [Microbacterium sp. 1154]|uniref:alpha/beta fold hydrolase n=1 Tax=Microbacterium sp. 1154 TaxID=2817733 RepID=UPI00285F8DD3|nr:alpha/beta hydrolase [Microbacterium sp. 1154]MDR6690772.1 pimeloyl-ACP methyl ester carboxylesterase [Microbacterium sp. 1154]
MKKSTRLALLIPPAAIVGVLAVTLATTATVNAVATRAEAAEITPYGERVPVGDRSMNVVINGDHPETIVLLPGLGTAAPGLDFAPLSDQLDDTYRVVAVEPFGTGLSDQTDEPRTAANIAREVHTALEYLGVDRYTLMGHSISGIYALTYVEAYRDEVTAFVGIDSSVPDQPGGDAPIATDSLALLDTLGVTRALRAFTPDPYEGLPYDASAREQMRLLANVNSAAPTVLDEMAHASTNFADASGRRFAADLPVLLFVREADDDVEGWVDLHRTQAASVDRGEVVLMAGEHYLHHTLSREIAQDTRRFLEASR